MHFNDSYWTLIGQLINRHLWCRQQKPIKPQQLMQTHYCSYESTQRRAIIFHPSTAQWDRRAAMNYAHQAMIARDAGNFDDARSQAEIAFGFELQAAKLIPDGEKAEPTRSILYRGAASLALQCSRYSDAIKLAGLALSGSPPPKIEKDLLSILDQVKFAMFLQGQGESLDNGELLLTMQGDAVGTGVVLYREFKDRIDMSEFFVQSFVLSPQPFEQLEMSV